LIIKIVQRLTKLELKSNKEKEKRKEERKKERFID
jgi:hypothetical protein